MSVVVILKFQNKRFFKFLREIEIFTQSLPNNRDWFYHPFFLTYLFKKIRRERIYKRKKEKKKKNSKRKKNRLFRTQ